MISPERFTFAAFIVAGAGMIGTAIANSIYPPMTFLGCVAGVILGIVMEVRSIRKERKISGTRVEDSSVDT
jgi:hypothetical protein